MTIKDVMEKTTAFFKQKGLSTPRLDSELLIAYGLGLERLQLYLKFDQPLKEEEIVRLRDLVRRRSLGEPIAYIIGKKEFYKSTFKVNSNVLIPRPETETLVELASEWLEQNIGSQKILDLGCGSGCIGLSLAKEFSESYVILVDKSNEAVQVSKENLAMNNVRNASLICADANHPEQVWSQMNIMNPQFDLIVANPPYISEGDFDIEENVKKYEPSEALFAADDGLYLIKKWIEKYLPFLRSGGCLIFEIGHNQKNSLLNWGQTLEIQNLEIKQDLAGKDRFLIITK